MIVSFGIDFAQAEQWGADGLFFGVGLIIPLYLGLRLLILNVLTHPTVTKLARGVDKLGQGAAGGIGGALTGFVDRLFGK